MIDDYGREWCDICQLEVFNGSKAEGAVICSEYCRGRYDEMIGRRLP